MLTQELFSEIEEEIETAINNEELRRLQMQIYTTAFNNAMNKLKENGVAIFEGAEFFSPVGIFIYQYLHSRLHSRIMEKTRRMEKSAEAYETAFQYAYIEL